MKCDQCEAAMINGVFCHETGCPNTHRVWNAETETWDKDEPDDVDLNWTPDNFWSKDMD